MSDTASFELGPEVTNLAQEDAVVAGYLQPDAAKRRQCFENNIGLPLTDSFASLLFGSNLNHSALPETDLKISA